MTRVPDHSEPTAAESSGEMDTIPAMDTALLQEEVGSRTEQTELTSVPNMPPFRVWAVLMNIIIGLGFLSIPYCFNSGLGTNTAVLLFIGVCTFLSFVLLVDASIKAGTTMDYTKLMRKSFPMLEWLPVLLIFLTLFGQGALHFQFWYEIIGIMI
jgi:hypothetical protein